MSYTTLVKSPFSDKFQNVQLILLSSFTRVYFHHKNCAGSEQNHFLITVSIFFLSTDRNYRYRIGFGMYFLLSFMRNGMKVDKHSAYLAHVACLMLFKLKRSVDSTRDVTDVIQCIKIWLTEQGTGSPGCVIIHYIDCNLDE